jgi:curved DNA-binding protein CbpA
MTKDFYEILGVNKNSPLEEIKKAYRKLAQKWHPDKWSSKSVGEREKANEKMQELNKAYEILGDEDKRKKYDLGETDFTSDFASADCEAEMEDIKEKIRRKQEEINLMNDMLENEEERERIMEEMWLLNAKYIDRYGTYNKISVALCFSFPRVYAVDLKSEGYSRLWEPYQDWLDKVWNMPITIIRGEKEESDELKQYKEEMIRAIKETEITLKIREENKKNDDISRKLSQARTKAFGYIEKDLNKKGLKDQDLGEYANYQEQMNNLDKVYKIRSLQEKILDHIFELNRRNPEPRPNDPPRDPRENPDRRFPDKPDKPETPDRHDKPQDKNDNQEKIETEKIENFVSGFRNNKYDNWTHEELVEEIKREQLNNASLQKLVSISETRIKELEEEIRELKAELPQTQEIRDEIQKREKKLDQWNQSRETLNILANNNNNNPWPIAPIAGVIGVVTLLGLVIYMLRRNKIKN